MAQLIWLFSLLYIWLQYYAADGSSFAYQLCHHDEGLALLQFKQAFVTNSADASLPCEYSRPKMISWNKTRMDCCTWDGVTCHMITGHVIGLDLSCSQPQGVIDPNSTLFELSHLQNLNLAYNDFGHAPVPHNIGGLARLTHLNLSWSNLYGQIPSEIAHLSKLISLDLSSICAGYLDCYFESHDIQMVFQNLTNMREILLGGVNISSKVPMNWSSSLTYVDLRDTGIHGKLPVSVFALQKMQNLMLYGNENLIVSLPKLNCSVSPPLRVLDLSFTAFLGGLSDSIGCLKSLNSLRMVHCGVSGPLPHSIGNLSQIVDLRLQQNKLIAPIPNSFANLQQLSVLILRRNNLTGRFPDFIWNLTNLAVLDFQDNSIVGSLPSNVSGLQKLKNIFLGNNMLQGELPSWLFCLQLLSVLHLENNQFAGQMPELKARSLQEIHLWNNQLSGSIPKSISTLHNLTHLDLSTNKLSGIIEFSMFSNLSILQTLILSNTRLSWSAKDNTDKSVSSLAILEMHSCELKEFPSFLRNLNVIIYLDLSNNKLQGQLPSAICGMEALLILNLSGNKFSGTIPLCFGNFSIDLEVLNLGMNGLQGSIPMVFANGNQLRNLGLNDNLLEGPLPRSLPYCKHLELIDLGNNKIKDTFPTGLGNLKKLRVLILKSNRFFGSIRTFNTELLFSRMQIFDLSCNEFSGVLPTNLFTSFEGMMNVGKSKYKAQYMYTEALLIYSEHAFIHSEYLYSVTTAVKGLELEYAKILTRFALINLSFNKFKGKIPDLTSLQVLNLSHNKISGRFPSALGKLSSLESLDLSWNQIEGEIPRQLADLTFLEVLNLSQNYLVGRIPHGKQFDAFPNNSYTGNLGLCGAPLTINCEESDMTKPPTQGRVEQEENFSFMSGLTGESVLIGYGCGIVLGLTIGSLMFITRKPKWLVRKIEEEIFSCVVFLIERKKVINRQKRAKKRGQMHR